MQGVIKARARVCRWVWGGLATLALMLSGGGTAISYTVQVAALSDQDTAQALRRTLLEAGYPAYLVSVPGETQTIFRLRVGAFADRAAAQAYAKAMRGVGGTAPVPALAEGIPPELIPVQPRLVARYPFVPEFERFDIVPWSGGAAVRTQGRFEDAPFIASYRVLEPGLEGAPFEAWRAVPSGDGTVQRVANFPLFSPEAPEAVDGQLGEVGEARLMEAAEALELTPDQVRPYIFYEPGRGAPFLIVAERFDPRRNTGGRYPALGNPRNGRVPPQGPGLTWFGRSPPKGFPEGLPEPLFVLSELFEEGRVQLPKGEVLSGDGWRAQADGRFTQLRVGERTWRAVVGYPLWAGGDYLLVYAGAQPVLYAISKP